MIAKYNRLSFLFGVPGLVLQIAGNVMRQGATPTSPSTLGVPLLVVGTALLLVGLALYAKAKGRHPAWCLLAFLSIIGLLILACLKDKTA